MWTLQLLEVKTNKKVSDFKIHSYEAKLIIWDGQTIIFKQLVKGL